MSILRPERIGKIRKIILAIIGFTVLIIGIAMIVLPGPAFVVIPIGLGILATEFIWARKLLKKLKNKLLKQKGEIIHGMEAK